MFRWNDILPIHRIKKKKIMSSLKSQYEAYVNGDNPFRLPEGLSYEEWLKALGEYLKKSVEDIKKKKDE